MKAKTIHILLADDDQDDCIFFKEALEELPVSTTLITVKDGVQLMHHLNKATSLPHLIYLDLNMPIKNGAECLEEIKGNDRFKRLPIIIYSTAFVAEVVKSLYEQGASYFIRKPPVFSDLKSVILRSLTLVSEDMHPTFENFIIHSK